MTADAQGGNDDHQTRPHTMITVTEPGQMIAATPHLLGFYPADSIVVLVIKNDHVDCVMRTDCPIDPAFYRMVASHLARSVDNPVEAHVAVVVVGTPAHDHDLARHLRDAFTAADMTVALFGVPEITQGAPWSDYDDTEHTGVLPDPAVSAVAVLAVTQGKVTLPSRGALVARVTPDADDVLARRAALLDTALDSQDTARSTDDWLELIRCFIERIVDGDEQFSDTDVVLACHALTTPGVRDRYLSLPVGSDAEAAEKLWLLLTRQCPAPACAEAATLLAVSAYSRGDGTFAAVALDRALAADPQHRLALVLHDALGRGVRPQQVRELITSALDPAI